MDIAAILIGVAIAAVVAAYVAEPLIHKTRGALRDSRPKVRGSKSEEYRAALEAIRDLDFDFQTGKVLKEDYGLLRERYAARGAALLRELDQMSDPKARAVSDEIEARVQARRKLPPAATCPACGCPYRAGDRFCGKCGAPLETMA